MSRLFLRNRLCMPVKGYNRSIVYDLIRYDYFFISNEVFELINTTEIIDFECIGDEKNREEIKEFLLKEEIIFEILESDEKFNFPVMNPDYSTPFLITDLIVHVDIDEVSIDKLSSFTLRDISILVDSYDKNVLESCLNRISMLEVDAIFIFLKEENVAYTYENFEALSRVNQLFNIYVFNSTYTSNLNQENELFTVIEIPSSFEYFSKNLDPNKLRINIEMFLEASNYHSYYHKKVYLDMKGNIKNGLYTDEHHGNLKNISVSRFTEIIESKSFQMLGGIKKENTLVCDVCEFRFMCVDSRMPYIANTEKWYHTVECTYNPYISKWKLETDYKPLLEVGVALHPTSGKLTIDYEILEQYNNFLWQ